MNQEDFKRNVWSVLCRAPQERDDFVAVDRTIDRVFEWGFTVQDAAAYCSCLEEFDPHIPEDIALKIMAKIMGKYL